MVAGRRSFDKPTTLCQQLPLCLCVRELCMCVFSYMCMCEGQTNREKENVYVCVRGGLD